MTALTSFGILWGDFPRTMGNIFYVSPASSYTIAGPTGARTYSASDNNRGTEIDKALATIGQALTLCTANAGDIIALLPGTHTLTATAAFSKAGVTMIGLPYWPETARHAGIGARIRHRPEAIVTISAAAAVALTCTAADLTFTNLCLRPITQAAVMSFTTACDRLTVRDCMIDMKTPVGHANTKGIIASGATQAPDGLNILNNLFLEGNGGTSCGIALEVGAAVNFLVAGNTFQHDSTVASSATWTAASQAQDNCQGTYLNNYVNGGGGTITAGFKGITHTGAGIVQFVGNLFTVAVTNPINGWAAADVGLLNNYVATVSGGTGGTLVTVST